jgi:hypothetical protein
MRGNTLLRGVGLALAVLCVAGDVAGQFISGRVVHAGTGAPLEGVEVQLRAGDGRRIAQSLTDSTGAFLMQASRTGSYQLIAVRIGMETVRADLTVGVSEEVEILLRMGESAVVLDPLTVEARSFRNIGPLAGYYERVARSQGLGLGTIITRDRIDERNAIDVTDLLREVPRITIVRQRQGNEVRFRGGGTGGCSPRIYIDGVMANRRQPAFVNDYVRPLDLEGIEIYQGLAQSPGEFHDTTGCGVLLLWTRRMPDSGSPMTWKRFLAGAGLFGLIILIGR